MSCNVCANRLKGTSVMNSFLHCDACLAKEIQDELFSFSTLMKQLNQQNMWDKLDDFEGNLPPVSPLSVLDDEDDGEADDRLSCLFALEDCEKLPQLVPDSFDFINGDDIDDLNMFNSTPHFDKFEAELVLNHDCMWSGQCFSEEHKKDSAKGAGKSTWDALPLSASPQQYSCISSFNNLELNPLYADSENTDDTKSIESDADEEIDVVSDDTDGSDIYNLRRGDLDGLSGNYNGSANSNRSSSGGGSCSRTRSSRSAKESTGHNRIHMLQESRNNVLVIKPYTEKSVNVVTSSPMSDHTYDDHSYFTQNRCTRPFVNDSPSATSIYAENSQDSSLGVLTPVESEDEDVSMKYATSLLSGVNVYKQQAKRKILVPSKTGHVPKFKFSMNVSSNSRGKSPQRSLLSEDCRNTLKRKAASANVHCPGQAVPHKSLKAVMPVVPSQQASRGTNGRQNKKHSPRKKLEKNKDNRDLHNSMERQRRVDLRQAFEYLKTQVPDIKTSDRASKLQILNKAALYCTQLTSNSKQLHREKEQEKSKNIALQKRLAQLKMSVINRVGNASNSRTSMFWN